MNGKSNLLLHRYYPELPWISCSSEFCCYLFLTRPSLSPSHSPILLNWHKLYHKRYIWIMHTICSSYYQGAFWTVWFIPLTLDPIIWRKTETHSRRTQLIAELFLFSILSHILHACWLLGPLWYFIHCQLSFSISKPSQWPPICCL